MAIEKLVCSNCKGALRWSPEDRIFTCEHCGSKFQTDNEFTYRIVNEAEIKKLEMEAEEKKHSFKDGLKSIALFFIFGIVVLLIGALIIKLISIA